MSIDGFAARRAEPIGGESVRNAARARPWSARRGDHGRPSIGLPRPEWYHRLVGNQVALRCAVDEAWGTANSDAPAAGSLERRGPVR